MTWHQLFCFLFLYLSAKDCFFLCKQGDFDRQLNGPVNGLLSLVIMQNLFSNVLKSNPNSWLTFFCFLSGCCFVSTHASGHTGVCGGKKIHLSREDHLKSFHESYLAAFIEWSSVVCITQWITVFFIFQPLTLILSTTTDFHCWHRMLSYSLFDNTEHQPFQTCLATTKLHQTCTVARGSSDTVSLL